MATRNANVVHGLRGVYGNQLGDELNVFCVSNIVYWEHRDESRDISRPFLDLSGILQIRKYCISIVSDSQHRAALQYINDSIPSVLAKIELWVQSGAGNASTERREAIRQSLDTLEARLRRVGI